MPAALFYDEIAVRRIHERIHLRNSSEKDHGRETSLAEFKGKLFLSSTSHPNAASPLNTKAWKISTSNSAARVLWLPVFRNDFKAQEPGTNEEIATFCTANFGVKFPLFEKITVVGEGKHPLYSALIKAQPKAVSLSNRRFARS